MDYKKLIDHANNIKNNAYAPYSNFKVGACVLTEDDKIYTGVNVENASFGATNCAERSAIFNAVSNGDKSIKAIAIISDSDNITYPCGICRQVILEFAASNTKIICCNNKLEYEVYDLKDLLPFAFDKSELKDS